MDNEQRTPRKQTSESGFSLIELIVVITIIGILASAVVVNVVGRDDDARVKVVLNDFSAIESACEMFRLDVGRYPDDLEELMNPPEGAKSNSYLKKTPRDPWTGEPYYYEVTDDGPRIWSYGADQSEGGEEYNADLFSDER